MKKKLNINMNDYTVLQLLYLLMSFTNNEVIKKELKRLIIITEKNVYGNFFNNLDDIFITDELVTIEYTFEN